MAQLARQPGNNQSGAGQSGAGQPEAGQKEAGWTELLCRAVGGHEQQTPYTSSRLPPPARYTGRLVPPSSQLSHYMYSPSVSMRIQPGGTLS